MSQGNFPWLFLIKEKIMELNSDITKVIEQIHPHLKDYLEEQGVEIDENGFFKCIHPNHPDKNPSCSIGGKTEGRVFHCFSCQNSGNIFHAAHYLEGRPLQGVGFFEQTLKYFAKKYGIEYEPAHISNEVRDLYQRRCATKDASSLIHSMAFEKTKLNDKNEGIKHLLDRGISEKTIKLFKIGCVPSFTSYMTQMRKLGWENANWLGEAGLANRALFNPHGVIIPVHNEKDQPVGFVTRSTKIKPNDKGESKYVNSIASNLYKKGEILFNYGNYDPKFGPLIIVEGYLDVVFMTQEGIKNVVALGSTVLTDKHVDMLARDSVKNIVLCLDGDDGGIAGTKLALERLAGFKTFKSIKVVDLPENEDPDSILRSQGKSKFFDYVAEAFTPFVWTLKHTNFQDDPLMVVESAIPSLVSEESHIKRLRMIKELSKLTGVPEIDIRKDVDEQVNAGSAQFTEELKDINQYVSYALSKRRLKDTKSILEEAVCKVKNLEKKYNNTVDNSSDFDEKIMLLKDKISGGQYSQGLITSSTFKEFREQLDGIPYTTCLTLVGGRPSAGKTCFLTSLGIDLVSQNEDAAIFYMSIDDTTELMVLKILAQKTGLSTSKIKKFATLPPDERDVIIDAWDWFENEIKPRFVLVDATAGNTPEVMEAHAEWFVKNYSDNKRVFLLDNFHKLRLPPGRQKAEAISALSEKVKEVTQLYDMHVMQTVELRKMGESADRPSTSDLKDSVQLEYDADIITLVHNELQVKPESPVFWQGQHPEEGTCAYPYLELMTWKNKITGKTGPHAYKLDKYNLRIERAQYKTEVASKRKKNAGSMNSIRAGAAY